MRRKELEKRIRKIAKSKGVEMTTVEGGSHIKVFFDGQWVTVIARHNEVPEQTARAIKNAENWEPK